MFSNFFKRSDGNEFEIRAVKDEQGALWFVGKDASDALGFTNAGQVTRWLDQEDFRTEKFGDVFPGQATNALGASRKIALVTESGLYEMIFRSERPEAKEFKRWVTHEVLPSIRKTGGYEGGDAIQAALQQITEDPIAGLQKMADLQRERDEARAQVQELTPLAQAFKEFTDSEDSASCRDAARLLNMPERSFTALLREWGWMEKLGTAATTKSRSAGWMVNKVVKAQYGARPVQGRLTGKGFELVTKKVAI